MALLFAALANGDSAVAQTADTPTPEATAESGNDFGDQLLPSIEGKLNPPQYPNMDSNLNRIVEQVETGQFTAKAADANAPIHREESVAVTLYVTEGYPQDVWKWLEDSGASPRNIGVDYIEAYIPVALLVEASQQEGVISVRTIIPPQPAQGVVVSEGVAAHGASDWHNAGYKGQDVKIGVIDVGFEGFRSLMGTELPASVEARCYTDIGVFTSNLADCVDSEDSESRRLHGTAVTEAIYDIAPDATYYIANTSSWGDLIATAEWMVEHDVDVINHSVSYIWQGPGDGTSPFSNAVVVGVNTAVEGGITWVNSAGNGAKRTWFGNFQDANGNTYHDYDGGDCNTAEIEAGEEFTAQLRWHDTWRGATLDLDLHLWDPGLTTELAWSEDVQAGHHRHIPREVLLYTPAQKGKFCLAISNFGDTSPDWIQLQVMKGNELKHHTMHHSIGNPAESANLGLLAVGAAGRNESVDNPFDTNTIEPFSSQGPAPDGRIKPDIVGADAGQSVTYRSDRNPDGYFFGTSQASPHVAGLAALVKQRFSGYTPAQVASYLKNNAEARGTVPNNTWGYGFARLPASDATTATPEPTPDPSATPETTPEPTPGPTETSTPVPTHTPVPTTTPEPGVPDDVLNRLSALETLVATLQGIISTLASRVAALEENVLRPAPTPEPTATPEPSATPVPTASACALPLVGTLPVTVPSSLLKECFVVNDYGEPFYFRSSQLGVTGPNAEWFASMTSDDFDTFLFLYQYNRNTRQWELLASNDDRDFSWDGTPPDTTNSFLRWHPTFGEYYLLITTTKYPHALGDYSIGVAWIPGTEKRGDIGLTVPDDPIRQFDKKMLLESVRSESDD